MKDFYIFYLFFGDIMCMKKSFPFFLYLLAIIMVLSLFSCSHVHAFSAWEITAPSTCETDGLQSRVCSTCGSSEYRPIPKTGHKYNNGEVQTKATYKNEGTMKYTCTQENCNNFYTEEYSLLPFDKLVDYIVTHGESIDGEFELCLVKGNNSSGTQYQSVNFSYLQKDNAIFLRNFVCYANNPSRSFMTTIMLDKDMSSSPYRTALYNNNSETAINVIYGYIDHKIFEQNTLLTYDSYEGVTPETLSMREYASTHSQELIQHLGSLSRKYLHLMLADFGFLKF